MNDPVRILHLEDNPRDAELARDTLQQTAIAFEFRVARDRAEYEAALADGRLSLILSDYNLPDYDGLSAMALARQKQPGVPFILLSGTLGEEQAVDCVLRGATDYVLKQRLQRLVPAVVRALSEAEDQRRRQTAEARLAQERELGEAILNNMPGVFYLFTQEGRMLRWNRAIETVTGYSAGEIAAMHPLDFFPAEQRALVREEILKVFATGQGEAEADILSKQGRRVPYHLTGATVVVDGKPCLAGTGLDMTQRKRAEEELRFLSLALHAAANAIAVIARDGAIRWVNDAFTTLTGYSAAEAIGQNPRLLKSGKHDTAFYKDLWSTILAGRVWRGELTNKRKDGKLYTEKMTITPVRAAGGEVSHFIAVKEDISPQRLLEDQLRQAQKMEVVGRLAGGVAHDFNNLLTPIVGYAEMALNRLQPGDRSRDYITEVKQAGERAAELTRQLLAFSRKQVLMPRVLDLNTLTANLRKMLRRMIEEHIELSITGAPDLGRILADPGQMEQAIVNLCVNARDAMPAGGTLAIATANADLDEAYAAAHPGVKPGRYVLLTVSDTGAGMSDEVKAHLFEPFFTTKPQGKGTGLGLSTVFGIVTQSGGHVAAESEVGRGTTFKIYLPRTEEKPGEHWTANSGPDDLPRGTETILLVEDDARVRGVSRIMLQDCGYRVLETSSGIEAVALAKQHDGAIHLLLTDTVMPGLNGIQTAREIRAILPPIKVIYMSGYTDTAILSRDASKSGAAFLQKPFSPAQLARKVREILDRKPAAPRPAAT